MNQLNQGRGHERRRFGRSLGAPSVGTDFACPQVMDLPISELDVWTFKKDTNGRWIWLRYSPDGEALAASRADYDELAECVADAKQRGYRGSLPTKP